MKNRAGPVERVFLVGGALLLLVVALALVWDIQFTGNLGTDAWVPGVRLQGEYRIAGGPWQRLTPGTRIGAFQGDVTFRGSFRLTDPNTGADMGPMETGTAVGLYCDHIHVTVEEGDGTVFASEAEDPRLGEEACGSFWSVYPYAGGETVTLTVHNPHRFGNASAVELLLERMTVFPGIVFETALREAGAGHRTLGLIIIISAAVMLGIALFLWLVHIRAARELGFVGAISLFAGISFLFSSPGVCFWNDHQLMNTTVLGLSMIFYLLTVDWVIAGFLEGISGNLARRTVAALGVLVMVLTALPLFTALRFYDLLRIWVIGQSVTGAALLSGVLFSLRETPKRSQKLLLLGSILPLGAFFLDAVAATLGWWADGAVSRYVFLVLFAVIVFLVIRVIPGNINAVNRARELETEQKVLQAELQRSRVATMMSQIKPHFIYNTLSSIEQLCRERPQAAAELVHSFGEYLQGNFRHVEDTAPIPFSREIRHVKHYTDIEQTRFTDITIKYDLQAVDFLIPPLTVQPLVENAIKHGLMGLEEGGVVSVRAEETGEYYQVTVSDDGVGFDPDRLEPGRGMGIPNIRGRLEAICAGTLHIESAPGKGTVARIRIPKQ